MWPFSRKPKFPPALLQQVESEVQRLCVSTEAMLDTEIYQIMRGIIAAQDVLTVKFGGLAAYRRASQEAQDSYQAEVRLMANADGGCSAYDLGLILLSTFVMAEVASQYGNKEFEGWTRRLKAAISSVNPVLPSLA